MAVHLLIVDALNLIRRIHAVQGTPCKDTCLHALEQLIRHSEPTHVVAVFDDEARNSGWRHQRLPDYKAGRAPMPDDLHSEMPMIRSAFEKRGVPRRGAQGNEAGGLAAAPAGNNGCLMPGAGHFDRKRRREIVRFIALGAPAGHAALFECRANHRHF